ncbi:heme biosynthesis HemY N-terminal domain-containing protein [Breoghania sp.]|uniref:heme biosynthesis protein HemY n=1 Tax=Breoghania sp. TaxID=2065378 RepID=UPI002AA6A6D3|nr:heme biosynthesis HemY N-terminal domain-containing protein [Breoghania sp.]
MVRVLSFFAIVFVIALGFAWMADRPGDVIIDWQGYRIEMGLMTMLIGLSMFVVALGIVWSILRSILRTPGALSRFFTRRRRDRGYSALSHGLIALGAGDARAAGKHGNEASKLLRNEPAARLLLAQSAQMSGRREEAQGHFEAMLEDDETRLLGLHGLFVEAERQKEPLAARHYAEEAHKLSPGLGWAGKAVLAYQAAAHDWEQAIVTLERNAHAKLIDKPTLRRQKAVLLTARAMELEDHEPDRARQLALEAHGLATDLVPAAVIAGRLLTRRGDVRKATKVLQATWKKFPHPDIAEAFAHVRPGDSARDRLKRVNALNDLRGHHVEGSLAIARAAIQARDWKQARDQLRPLLRTQPTQRVFLLMADLEEGEHGDRGRVREWLSRAVRAPRDPAWTADGIVADAWAPVSPITGKLDAFEWKAPMERLGGPENDDSADLLDMPPERPVAEEAKTVGSPMETLKAASKPSQTASGPIVSCAPSTDMVSPGAAAAATAPEEKKPAEAAVEAEPAQKIVEVAAAVAETKEALKAEAQKGEAETSEAATEEAKKAEETKAPAEPQTPADRVKAKVAQRLAAGKTAPSDGAEKPAEAKAEAPAGDKDKAEAKDEDAARSVKGDDLETVGDVKLPRPPDDPGVDGDDDIPRRARKFF